MTDCFLVTYLYSFSWFVFHSAISDNKSTLTYRTAVWPSKLHGRCRDVWQNTPWTNTHTHSPLTGRTETGASRISQKLWERGVSNNRFIFLQRPWKTWPPSHCRSFVEEDKRSAPTEIPQPREISHVHDWCEIKQLNFTLANADGKAVSTWGNSLSLFQSLFANTSMYGRLKSLLTTKTECRPHLYLATDTTC